MYSPHLRRDILALPSHPAQAIHSSTWHLPSLFQSRWLPRALGIGVLAATCALAVSFKSPSEVQWLTDLADGGDAGAQLQLGLAYRDGRLGLTPDQKVSIQWLRMSAGQGNAYAASALGDAYARQAGTSPDAAASAVQWWRKAAQAGNADAQRHLSEALVQRGDTAAGDAWVREGSIQGRPEAVQRPQRLSSQDQVLTGDAEGEGTLASLAARLHSRSLQALSYVADLLKRTSLGPQSTISLRKAAEAGDSVAQYQLGIRYRDGGWGVERDPNQARGWLSRAAASGNTLAGQALASLERD
ncbi:MAG: tetratricopeptide repeat protein [Chromatiaceae bacterium]